MSEPTGKADNPVQELRSHLEQALARLDELARLLPAPTGEGADEQERR